MNGQTVVLSPEEEAELRAQWALADAKKVEALKNLYQEDRRREYPSIEAQLDMLWHGMDTKEIPMCKEFYESIKAVKDKFVKPEGV